jgi:hypothetical protein
MKNFYKIVTLATSLLFLYLSFQMLFMADSFVRDLGLKPSLATEVLSKRVAMFMLGIAVLMFAARNLSHSAARQIICLATAITLSGLSIMGTYELIRGTVNNSMLVAITTETILWVSFAFIILRSRNQESQH